MQRIMLLGAKDVFTVSDVAFLTGRTEKTIRNRIKSIPHHKGPFGIVFDRHELKDYLLNTTHK